MEHTDEVNPFQRRAPSWGVYRRQYTYWSEQVISQQQQDRDSEESDACMDIQARYASCELPSHHRRSSFQKQDQMHIYMETKQKPPEKRTGRNRQDETLGSWFKIIIPFGIKYDEKWLLNLIQKQSSVPFTAFEFHYEKMQAQFFVENANIACALKNVNGKIFNEVNEKIFILVEPCESPQSVQKALTSEKVEQIKFSFLDLSNKKPYLLDGLSTIMGNASNTQNLNISNTEDGQETLSGSKCATEAPKFLSTCKAVWFPSRCRPAPADTYAGQTTTQVFSVSPRSSARLYFKDNRNTEKLKDPNLRVQMLKHTKHDIVHALCALPKTQHDFSSFVVDMCFQTISRRKEQGDGNGRAAMVAFSGAGADRVRVLQLGTSLAAPTAPLSAAENQERYWAPPTGPRPLLLEPAVPHARQGGYSPDTLPLPHWSSPPEIRDAAPSSPTPSPPPSRLNGLSDGREKGSGQGELLTTQLEITFPTLSASLVAESLSCNMKYGLRVEVLRRRTCSKNQEEQETARIGPGAMASKEEQAVKNHSMEDANQENEKKDGKDQDANKREPMALLSGASEYYVPRGNRRRFRVRQPILHYRWDVTQRLGEPQARMREENMERIGEEIFRSVAVGANPDKERKDRKYQCRQRRANLNMEKVYRENEGKLENKGNVGNEGKPEDEVQSENEGQSTEKEKLEVERKSEREPEVQNERKPDNERQPAGEGKQEKQGKSEAERNPLREGKRESQAEPGSQSHAAAKRPAEDYVPRKAKRKTNRTTEDSPTH
ncbi:hypothetical protein MJG53_020196 [Ovis ammon polii x Ovis aries]|uniref:Uncharacterized protein n=1 Tax=Ovis ammon polii x Ovis aries TaxID=2918886 RepID=A0ACB9U210_9CETA|nr:hypothetical protein MJG53_020196 [Ovis ammon polii x Ovis aries]